MIVLTVGTFDLYHRGHVFLLAQARKLAGPDGKVIVGVNTSEFVREFKEHAPTQTYDERVAPLAACRYVDQILCNNSKSLKGMIQDVQPDILLIGQDWALKNYYGQIGISQEWLNMHEVSLVYIPRAVADISSTELRERIRARRVDSEPIG